MSSDTSAKNQIKDYSSLLKLGLPVTIIFSLSYEISFFWGLGISINQTPLSLNDFIRGWIEWLPTLIPLIIFLGLYELTIRRIEQWKTEEELINQSSNPKMMRKLRDSPYRFIVFLGILGIIQFILFGEYFLQMAQLGVLVIIIFYTIWVLQGSPINLDKKLFLIIYLTIFVLSLFLVNGYQKGSKVASGNQAEISITIDKNNSTLKTIRIFDQWSLVRINPDQLGWLHHQSDRLIKIPIKKEPFKGIACSRIEEFCNQLYKTKSM